MARQYDWKYKCPYCRKPYAKKTFWIRHIKDCKKKEA